MGIWGFTFGRHFSRNAWRAIAGYCVLSFLSSTSLGLSAEEPTALELVKAADGDSAAAYGEIVVNTATAASMKEVLGEPISSKERSCIWIGSEGCRALGLKMVRANYTEAGVLSHMTLDVQEPFPCSEALESLGLDKPAEVRESKGVAVELFPSANLALGVHGDRVIRLYLFGSQTPGTAKKKPDMSREEALDLLDKVMATVTQEEKDIALRVAVSVGCVEAVSGFLASGADPMLPNPQGGTALHDAAFAGHAEVIAPLVFGSSRSTDQDDNGGQPINSLLDKQNNDGATALFVACLAGHYEAAKTLLRMGADPNIADAEGRTPLHLAALSNDVELVEALLLSRAGVYLRNQRGRSSLDLATDKEVRLLLGQAAARDGEDPAKEQVRKVVEAFLQATCDGDLAKLKLCLLPSLRKDIPEEMDEAELEWTVRTVDLEAGTAKVLCDVTQPAESSEQHSYRARFRVQYAEDAWWISDVDMEPQSTIEAK